ncbi:hypothetical protein [Hymenobacter sp. BT559]|uniref:hypothetical protein n=1 Tax=Hymenobacter sp. BT559 TaxID=2795729 RepID=UPI0018EC5D48|nr:hypothetical protein [Hymenobacter sp. BT559]MBJ6145497.1 hypothetical protein [Hymenobacter sp. BT559]
MNKKLFSVTGNKIASLLLGKDSLLFSSQEFNSEQGFVESWNKKLSLATKIEVKYTAIKSVGKEDNDDAIKVKYRTAVGIPGVCEFSCSSAGDCEQFFSFLEQEHAFDKHYAAMTPFKAVLNYIIGLVATVGVTVLSYFEALKVANGTAEIGSSGKARTYYALLEFLGDKGVLVVGGAFACYLLYKIWTRATNPPHQLLLLPQAA